MPKFLRYVFTLSFGSVFSQLLYILSAPVLTRLTTPEDFFQLAFFIAIIAVLSTVSTGKLELAVMETKLNALQTNIIYAALIYAFIFSSVLFLLSKIFSQQLILIPNLSDLSFALIAISLFLQSTFQSLTVLLNRKSDFSGMSIAVIIRGFITVTSQILICVFMQEDAASIANGLVIGYILGQTVACVYLLYKTSISSWVKLKAKTIRYILLRFSRYPRQVALSSMFNSLSANSPVMILQLFFKSSLIGQFALSQRVLQAPMRFLGTAIGQVFYNRAANAIDDRAEITRIAQNLCLSSMTVILIPSLILYVYCETIFEFVFGDQWMLAGSISKNLFAWLWIVFITSPLTPILNIYHRQELFLKFNIILILGRTFILIVLPLLNVAFESVILTYGIYSAVCWLILLSKILNILDISTMTKIICITLPSFVIIFQCIERILFQ